MIGAKIDLQKIKPLPLVKRNSLSTVEEVLVPLDVEPAAIGDALMSQVDDCAKRIREAKDNGKAVMMIYGAHLIKNGAALILDNLIANSIPALDSLWRQFAGHGDMTRLKESRERRAAQR